VLGAHRARLEWEEHRVFGEVRGRANRLANCDQANAAGQRSIRVTRKDADWNFITPSPHGTTTVSRGCSSMFSSGRLPLITSL